MRYSFVLGVSAAVLVACSQSDRAPQSAANMPQQSSRAMTSSPDTATIPAVMPAADTGGRWLDHPLRTWTWNAPGVSLPQAPALEVASPYDGRCARNVHAPATAADSIVVRHGWSIVAPDVHAGNVTVIVGAADADGMCRPWKYQAFVFAHGQYAGTLSPHPMNSRMDGDLSPLTLTSDTMIVAHFKRYVAGDPLCCASGESTVIYRVAGTGSHLYIVPVRAETRSVSR